MPLLEELVSIGFETDEAQKLAGDKYFHHKRKTCEELRDLFNKISGIYDCTFIDVKKAILSFPRFAGLDHERIVRQGVEVYGIENEDKVKKAILSFPRFAGLDHERIVRQGVKLGRMAGLFNNEVIDYILDKPVLASYSVKRYLAGFDVGRQLKKEGFAQDKIMLGVFIKYYVESPYVPNSNRARISQAVGDKEPPLLKAMRKSLHRLKNCRTDKNRI